MRKITIRNNDGIIEYSHTFSRNDLDSEQLHLALCEIDPGENYTVTFENVEVETTVTGKNVQIGDIIGVFGKFTERTKVTELTETTIYTATPAIVFSRTNESFVVLR